MRARPVEGFESGELFEGAHWHQRWEVFPGIFTPGPNDVAALCERAGVPTDLTGLRVLDVGAYNGCVALECERRGAEEVVAVDIMNPERTGFTKLRAALGATTRFERGSVYDLDPDVHGTFDLVLFFGVLYHLRYPHLALDRLRTVCRGTLLVETHVLDGMYAHRRRGMRLLGRLFVRLARRVPLWRQYRPHELHSEDASNFLGPNATAVVEALGACGFRAQARHVAGGRGTFEAIVESGAASRVARDSYEARFASSASLAGVPLREDPLFEP